MAVTDELIVGRKKISAVTLDVSTTKLVNFLLSYWIRSSTIMCLTSSTRQQEIFAGGNFRKLVFDCKNRENFPLYGTLFPLPSLSSLSPLLSSLSLSPVVSIIAGNELMLNSIHPLPLTIPPLPGCHILHYTSPSYLPLHHHQ